MIRSVHYRVGQFLRALTARAAGEESEQALRLLPPVARELFHRQWANDQRHALDVHATLCRQGHTDPDLLAAALLHDAGKAAARITVWQRTAIVLLAQFAPRLLARLGQGTGEGWRRSFVVHARHAEIGARWAREAGCSPLTVALIRSHQERRPERTAEANESHLLAALQAADSVN